MRVPVLTLDCENITKVIAIATAISSLAPEKHLLYEWMSYLTGTLHGAGFGNLTRPQRWTGDLEAFEGIQVKARTCVKDCFDWIEGRLERGWAVGEEMMAVDPYLFVFWRRGNEAGFEMKVKYKK